MVNLGGSIPSVLPDEMNVAPRNGNRRRLRIGWVIGEACIRSPAHPVVRGAFIVNLPVSIPMVLPDDMNGVPGNGNRRNPRRGGVIREACIRSPAHPLVRGTLMVNLPVSVPAVIPDEMDRISEGRHTPNIVTGFGSAGIIGQPPIGLPLGVCRGKEKKKTNGHCYALGHLDLLLSGPDGP
jgi:hypothetical protein